MDITLYTRDCFKSFPIIVPDWEKFVMNKALAWMNTTLDWLKFEGPLHLVFYEDLIDNLPSVIVKASRPFRCAFLPNW